jgi:AsmA family protein
MRVRSPLFIAAISFLGLVLAVVLGLTVMDWNRFKGPIERSASARFGRTVTIAGPLKVRFWSRTPTVTINDLSVGSPPWEANRPLLKVARVQFQLELLPSLLHAALVLRRVELDHPNIYLHQEKSGRANWTFENNAPTKQRATQPPRLPAMRDLVIDSGTLVLIDELRRLKVKGTVVAAEQASGKDSKPFRIQGKGTINDEPFRLDIAGGPLQALTPDEPYPFSLAIKAGENDVQADGKLLKPFDLARLELDVKGTGRDLAELFYLTQITLPNSPPYKLRAHIVRNGKRIDVRQIAASLGGSDVTGKVDIDASTKRPLVKADLVSKHLLLKDFAAITGSNVRSSGSLAAGEQDSGGRAGKGPASSTTHLLFPTSRLQVDRVRAVDAEVRFRATSIEAGTVPFTQVSMQVKLDDGVLTLDPLRLDMAQGWIAGDVRVDARSQSAKVRADLHAADIQLSQFKSKAPNAAPPIDGLLDARAVIEGTGDSVHEVMSDATGTFTMIVPQGDVRSAFAELTGVDVAEGIGLLVKKPDDRAPIRCGVAQFDLETGTAHAQDIVFDTQNVLVKGGGQVYLDSEQLDLTIRGQPKKVRIVRLRAPVQVKGQLLKPSFKLETGHLLKQGAIGAALGTVLSPIAAILAFVDPGLAKDQNCAQLLAQAQQPPSTARAARQAEAPTAESNR